MTPSAPIGQPPADPQLEERLAKAKALLEQPCDEQWIAETIEIEGDSWCEAGLIAKPYAEYLQSLTPEQHRSLRLQAQLLSILLPELKQWVITWGLGLSFDPVYLETRQILFRHLKRLTEEQPDWISALVEEDNQHLPLEERGVRSQTSRMLTQLFLPEDWEQLATIAAEGMSAAVRQISQAAVPVSAKF